MRYTCQLLLDLNDIWLNAKEKKIVYKNRGVRDILDSLYKTPEGAHQLIVYPNLDVLREIYFHYFKKQLETSDEIIVYIPYYETIKSVKKFLVLANVQINSKSNGDDEVDNRFEDKNKDKDDNDNNNDKNSNNTNNNDNKKNSNQVYDNTLNSFDLKKYIQEGTLILVDSNDIFSNNDKNRKSKIKNNSTVFKKELELLIECSINRFKKNKEKYTNDGSSGDGVTCFIDMGFCQADRFETLIECEKSLLPSSSVSLSSNHIKSYKIKYCCLYSQEDFEKYKSCEKNEILEYHNRNIIFID